MSKTIRQPKGARDERPFMVIWEVTQACDLACRHCRADARPYLDPGILSTQEGRQLLEQVTEFERPYPLLVFTGGDPFKRSDLFELVRYGESLGLATAVSPSGTPLLNSANLVRLKEAGARAISLSIDASNADQHDLFRGVPGSFQQTLDGWDAAQEAGLKVQINSTVSRYNLGDLPDLAALIATRRVMTWSVFFLVPTGRAQADQALDAEEFESVLAFLGEASRYLSIKTTEGHHFKRVLLQREILQRHQEPVWESELSRSMVARFEASMQAQGVATRGRTLRPPMHINSGNGFVFVSQWGHVFPSGFLPVSAGNVKQQPLKEIYRSSPLMQSLRNPDQLGGKCGHCEFRTFCGGSRSRALALTGDVLAEEPMCLYEPGTFPYAQELEQLAGLT